MISAIAQSAKMLPGNTTAAPTTVAIILEASMQTSPNNAGWWKGHRTLAYLPKHDFRSLSSHLLMPIQLYSAQMHFGAFVRSPDAVSMALSSRTFQICHPTKKQLPCLLHSNHSQHMSSKIFFSAFGSSPRLATTGGVVASCCGQHRYSTCSKWQYNGKQERRAQTTFLHHSN